MANLDHDTPTLQSRDSGLAQHFDRAERLLTEVSHSSGRLDETTRGQVHDLLVSNAMYMRKAREHGNVADAAILDSLDRTLTGLEHEAAPEETSVAELNTQGLLLDLRILQQNDSTSTKEVQ